MEGVWICRHALASTALRPSKRLDVNANAPEGLLVLRSRPVRPQLVLAGHQREQGDAGVGKNNAQNSGEFPGFEWFKIHWKKQR